MVCYDGKTYHKHHFQCDGCTAPLESDKPVLKCGKFILCQNCGDTSTVKCFACKAKFNQKYLIIDGNCFHFQCFICAHCNKNIGKSAYKCSEEKVYYHSGCYDELHDPWCEFCNQQITETEMSMYNGVSLHTRCFDSWQDLAYPIEEYLSQVVTYEALLT